MRWIISGLLIFNLGYLIFNFVQYVYFDKSTDQITPVDTSLQAAMPGAPIVLVDEITNLSKEKESPNNTNSGDGLGVVSAVDAQKKCYLIGPLVRSDTWSSAQALNEAAVQGIKAQLVNVDVANVADYWVYLPPEESRERALLKLTELNQKKIDSYVIAEGNLLNGISLGIFDKKANAERKQNELVQAGYGAKVLENIKKSKESWLQIDAVYGGMVNDEVLRRIGNGQIEIKLKSESCIDVASEGEIN